jgi:hypothetical protein
MVVLDLTAVMKAASEFGGDCFINNNLDVKKAKKLKWRTIVVYIMAFCAFYLDE